MLSLLHCLLWSVLALVVTYVFYQTQLHPLSQYPGPFIAKLTNLIAVYHSIKGTRHSHLYLLHQQHGPVVRCGPNHISVNDAAALEPIYGAKANVRKSSWYTVFHGRTIWNTRDSAVHSRKKRVMSAALSENAARNVQAAIVNIVRDWSAALDDGTTLTHPGDQQQWSHPKDMSIWSAYLIFDCLGQLLYGRSFDTTRTTHNRAFLEMLPRNIRVNNILGQIPSLRQFNLAKVFLYSHMQKSMDRIKFSTKVLQSSLADPEDGIGPKNILSFLKEARNADKGTVYSDAEMISEINLLLAAGSDTTNTALAALFYFLSQHQDMYTRLAASVRGQFPTLDAIASDRGHALATNVYLKACVNEALRLCPPVPGLLAREISPGGLAVLGHHFPAGVIIGVPTYSLHHNDAYFSHPFSYDPNRWLDGNSGGRVDGSFDGSDNTLRTPITQNRQRQAFAPFSVGPRGCIGRNVALMELYLAIAHVVWLYDMRQQLGSENMGLGPQREYKIKDHFVVAKEGPILQFRRRDFT